MLPKRSLTAVGPSRLLFFLLRPLQMKPAMKMSKVGITNDTTSLLITGVTLSPSDSVAAIITPGE